MGVMLLLAQLADAQPKEPSTLSNPLAQVMVAIMVMLALAIALMGNVVINAADLFRKKLRKARAEKNGGNAVTVILLLGAGLLASIAAQAQAAPDAAATAPVADNSINGLSPFTFYLLTAIIAVEIIILIVLVYQLKFLVGIESKKVMAAAVEEKAVAKVSWWERINRSTKIEDEAAIDLSHDYDGISELDNKLPPWWIAAFTLTILFSVVYLYRYHVSHSAPLQIEELQLAMKQAEEEKAAYLAKTASNVDENSVTMLDAAGIASGKALFAANCTPCHGQAGEGNTVGPNLTDNYWIHGGDIKDVFKSIKYGWVEKGMRSWKDDFSPIQIAQLASYVKSLKGTNPPNAKEPQGEFYEENQAAGATSVTDSTASPSSAK